MCNFQSAHCYAEASYIPQPLLPSGEKGSKSGSKSLSALGEGLKPSAYMKRVRGFRKVAHRVLGFILYAILDVWHRQFFEVLGMIFLIKFSQ